MAKLYELDQKINELIANSIDPETGEVSDGFIEKLDALNMERNEKIDNIMRLYKNLISDAAGWEAEEKRLSELKKSAKNRAESLKNYLSRYMEAGVEKFTSEHGKIGWRKSEKVVVQDVDTLPEEFKKVKVEVKADLISLKNALKEDRKIDGVSLEEHQNIQIK
ncbi:siphovirus Gp157 family protein [Dialister invisus]|uniref:siphovirus Gp157 family protein n=1 Tax=Dialister invisus TaxID=218538 RepID=UPI0026713FA0|nr:siphovirus Gp157 family protein [Dialister invisus]